MHSKDACHLCLPSPPPLTAWPLEAGDKNPEEIPDLTVVLGPLAPPLLRAGDREVGGCRAGL